MRGSFFSSPSCVLMLRAKFANETAHLTNLRTFEDELHKRLAEALKQGFFEITVSGEIDRGQHRLTVSGGARRRYAFPVEVVTDDRDLRNGGADVQLDS